MRFVVIVAAVALIFAFTLPAYAETQSVKVSGDLTIHAIARDNFDLDKNRDTGQDFPTGVNVPTGMSKEHFIMTIAEVQVDADLTDNVSTVIRIVNQRNWGDSDYKTLVDPTAPQADFITVDHDLLDLGVDLAYVQIRELFFEPLSIRIGRQDLWFGRGLIIGANLVDPGLVESNMPADSVERLRGIGAPEYTAYRSFDAVRATIDFEKYAPFVVDLVYFRNDQGTLSSNSIDVVGVNAGYNFDVYNAELESYYWFRRDNNDGNNRTASSDDIHTIGLRGSFNPTEDWLFGGEAAMQFGTRVADVAWSTTETGTASLDEQDRFAGMMNAYVDYLGWQKYMYSPKVGAEVIWTSGDDTDPGDLGDTFTQWNPMYRGYFPTMIRPYLGRYYFTSRYPLGEDLGITNQWEVMAKGSLQPLDDVSVEGIVSGYYLDRIPIRLGENSQAGWIGSHHAGTELNIKTSYDYTEDVTFSLATAWFWPGDVYEEQSHQNEWPDNPTDLQPTMATEIVGSCKVSF
jgi:hypothetical protein